jgi:hydrogen peroxide-dependent heme synthase
MKLKTKDTVYVLYPVFAASDELRTQLQDPDDLQTAAMEAQNLFKAWDERIEVRGTYSTVGFRADSDMAMWLVGRSSQDLQDFLVAFRRTTVGRLIDLTWTFMGVVKAAEFSPDHLPAFVRGALPKTYFCVYPFVRTPEWYLLKKKKRRALLAEHGKMGRKFPDVSANTTSAFGLGDWEWILAFEADEADRLVDCIRRLRDAKARRYTKEEIPFITGIRKPIDQVLDDLV